MRQTSLLPELIKETSDIATAKAPKTYKVPVYRCALVREGMVDSEPYRTSETVADTARKILADYDREAFVILLLDTKNHLIGVNIVSVGTLTASLVHPREVFKPAIAASASAVIGVHNHPSGDPQPSREDADLTRRLWEAGKLLGIRFLDHVIPEGTSASATQASSRRHRRKISEGRRPDRRRPFRLPRRRALGPLAASSFVPPRRRG